MNAHADMKFCPLPQIPNRGTQCWNRKQEAQLEDSCDAIVRTYLNYIGGIKNGTVEMQEAQEGLGGQMSVSHSFLVSVLRMFPFPMTGVLYFCWHVWGEAWPPTTEMQRFHPCRWWFLSGLGKDFTLPSLDRSNVTRTQSFKVGVT